MTNIYKFIIAFLIGLFVFGLGMGAGYGLTQYYQPAYDGNPENTPENFALFWEVWNIVDNKFYSGIPNNTTTTYGAIKGALSALEDPYTVFVEPQPRALEKAQLDGQFGGIGAYVHKDEAGQFILDPMVDSPAEQAGLLKDDVLVQVEDTPVTPEMTTDDVVLLIRGEVGTDVTLQVSRQDQASPVTLVITRAIIETPSVEWQLLTEDPVIGYIQIRLFSNRTGQELERAMTELRQDGASKYIIDLRNNGGGLLDAAIDVSSLYLSDGVVLTEDRRGQEPKVYKVRRGQKFTDAPLVVLVNGGTASASEIVAGALQDTDRAVLIGEKTFGKGSVQLVYDLSDDSSVHVTVAKWFTPNNASIDGVGLVPDIEILFTEEDHTAGTDPQFLKAVEYLQSGSSETVGK